MTRVKWEPKYYRYIATLNAKGWTWDQIAVALASKFGLSVLGDTIRRQMAPGRAGNEYLHRDVKSSRAGIGEIKRNKNVSHNALSLLLLNPLPPSSCTTVLFDLRR